MGRSKRTKGGGVESRLGSSPEEERKKEERVKDEKEEGRRFRENESQMEWKAEAEKGMKMMDIPKEVLSSRASSTPL